MAVRKELLRIVETLSEAELEALIDYARFLTVKVDEPLSDAERIALVEAKEERRKGGRGKVKLDVGLG